MPLRHIGFAPATTSRSSATFRHSAAAGRDSATNVVGLNRFQDRAQQRIGQAGFQQHCVGPGTPRSVNATFVRAGRENDDRGAAPFLPHSSDEIHRVDGSGHEEAGDDGRRLWKQLQRTVRRPSLLNVETLAAQVLGVHLSIVRLGVDQEQGDRGAVFQGKEISKSRRNLPQPATTTQPARGGTVKAK